MNEKEFSIDCTRKKAIDSRIQSLHHQGLLINQTNISGKQFEKVRNDVYNILYNCSLNQIRAFRDMIDEVYVQMFNIGLNMKNKRQKR